MAKYNWRKHSTKRQGYKVWYDDNNRMHVSMQMSQPMDWINTTISLDGLNLDNIDSYDPEPPLPEESEPSMGYTVTTSGDISLRGATYDSVILDEIIGYQMQATPTDQHSDDMSRAMEYVIRSLDNGEV